MAEKIKVAVAGALGRMGQEPVKAVAGDEDLELVGAVDVQARGQKLSEVVGLSGLDLDVVDDLATLIQARRPDVIVDFTNAQAVFDNVRTTVGQGLTSVVGSAD